MSNAQPLPDPVTVISNEKASPSLVYRALLRSLGSGTLEPGAKLPNERELASQLNTSRTAVRSALSLMERQGLVRRQVGAGTFLTEDAASVFERLDQTSVASHEEVPSFLEIAEGRLLFEPAMMHLVATRAEPADIACMRRILDKIIDAPTWRDFKEAIYALHQQLFSATKNRFLMQIMDSILADRRAVAFDGRDTDKPAPDAVRRQTHKELEAIVDAIANQDAKRAENLVSDHLMRTLATINIWR